jgi:hypothetical protein
MPKFDIIKGNFVLTFLFSQFILLFIKQGKRYRIIVRGLNFVTFCRDLIKSTFNYYCFLLTEC